MKIDGAIFDVDGTILDSMYTWNHVCENMLRQEGIEPEPGLGDKLFAMTVELGATYMKEHYPLDEYTVPQLMEKVNEYMENYYRTEADFKPGAKELLDRLYANGVKMTVATSTEKYCVEAAFERLGISHYFMDIFSCAVIGITKEQPDLFHMARDLMGTEIENTWVFEDGLYSMETAKKEGFKIAGVYDEVSLADQEAIKEISDIYLTNLGEFPVLE